MRVERKTEIEARGERSCIFKEKRSRILWNREENKEFCRWKVYRWKEEQRQKNSQWWDETNEKLDEKSMKNIQIDSLKG